MISRWSILAAMGLALLIGSARTAHANGIDSYVDANQIRLGESVEYIIDIEQTVQQVVPPESSGFRVVGQSTRTNVRVINGTVERTMSYRFRLAPTKVGTLATGAARVRFPDGTMVRGSSFDVEVLDARQARSPAPTARPGRSAPVRPQRTGSGTSLQGQSGRQPNVANSVSNNLPQIPSAGSSELFSSGIPADGREGAFVVAMISDNEPYVGEQLIADYLLFSPVTGFGMNAQGLTEPEFSNFWFDDITDQRRANNRSSMLGTERVGGKLYEVHLLRSFLILPLEAGEAIVPPIELTVSDSSLFGRQDTREIGSPPLQIDVRPLPTDGQPTDFRAGNVGRFTLTADAAPDRLKLGETGRVQISLRGAGIASRVVPPDVQLPDSVRQFPHDDNVTESVSQQGWMELTQTRDIAFSPLQEGSVRLPSISFSYFDPWSERYKTIEAELPDVTVSGVREGYTPPDPANGSASTPDAWLAALPDPRTLQPVNSAPSRLTPFRGSLSYWTIVSTPFLLVLFTAGLRRFRTSREKNAPERRKEHAGKIARKRIDALDATKTQSFSDMAQILRRYIGVKSQSPCKGATLARIREIAGQHFGRPGFRLAEIVEEAEHARFSGATADDFSLLRDRAVDAIQSAEQAADSEATEV